MADEVALLARVDAATVQTVTTLGDSPLTLALKRSSAAKCEKPALAGTEEGVRLEKLCIVLAENSDVNHTDRAGKADIAMHF